MQGRSKQSSAEEPVLEGVFRHRNRLTILAYLMGREMGADEAELASALTLTKGQVEYHLKILGSADLVVSVDREPGASEHYIAA